MDDGAITVEGAEACQGELAIGHGSLGNGIINADGAQSHGAEREALLERGHNWVRQRMWK